MIYVRQRNFSDFERGMTAGARYAGLNISETIF